MSGLDVVLVSLGGSVGAVARFVLDGAVTARVRGRATGVPPGTLLVNAVGALVLGVLVGLAPVGATPWWLLAGGTGFCGGLTTFSTASAEAARRAVEGRWGSAGAITAAHLLVSLAAAAAGLALAEVAG